jgi:hypothetical protein
MIDIEAQLAHAGEDRSRRYAGRLPRGSQRIVTGGQRRRRRTYMTASTLRSLHDLGETVAFADEDVRGRKVLDNEGNSLGIINGLMIDDAENRVRLFRVECGGFLGLGATHVLIPVDAITSITSDSVTIHCGGEHLRGAPRYDPKLVKTLDESYCGDVYGYYGYSPYWDDGYQRPPYSYHNR